MGHHKPNSGVCDYCKKESPIRKSHEQRTSWFRGDDEVWQLCPECFQRADKLYPDAIDEQKKHRKAARDEEYERYEAWADKASATLQELGYEVEQKTFYQWRINGVLDVYPVNQKYHKIQVNKRGEYSSLIPFIKRTLHPKI